MIITHLVMVRLDRTIQKSLKRLEKDFYQRLEGVLDPPVKPEDDETFWPVQSQFYV